uniref:Uncharacterized protein n=1 Tax=Lotharella oceanica TaxID=641309 RepID=A0A7S2X6Y7_9EUKA|mmetsp:Transcript_11841/g.22824  ORF Transcript_11841/g.22824 Transcript_11841/m.22824 type:complete len:363 (-) Transcript_11841:55-1143(-)
MRRPKAKQPRRRAIEPTAGGGALEVGPLTGKLDRIKKGERLSLCGKYITGKDGKTRPALRRDSSHPRRPMQATKPKYNRRKTSGGPPQITAQKPKLYGDALLKKKISWEREALFRKGSKLLEAADLCQRSAGSSRRLPRAPSSNVERKLKSSKQTGKKNNKIGIVPRGMGAKPKTPDTGMMPRTPDSERPIERVRPTPLHIQRYETSPLGSVEGLSPSHRTAEDAIESAETSSRDDFEDIGSDAKTGMATTEMQDCVEEDSNDVDLSEQATREASDYQSPTVSSRVEKVMEEDVAALPNNDGGSTWGDMLVSLPMNLQRELESFREEDIALLDLQDLVDIAGEKLGRELFEWIEQHRTHASR